MELLLVIFILHYVLQQATYIYLLFKQMPVAAPLHIDLPKIYKKLVFNTLTRFVCNGRFL